MSRRSESLSAGSADVVEEITRVVIVKAQRERGFVARAMRCDSTVVEADPIARSDGGCG